MNTEKTFTLTYSQCKAVIENLGRDELETFISDINNQPKFLKFMGEIEDVAELIAISEGGCASGAYMPAVTYATALECMFYHSESVEGQIEYMEELTFNIGSETFSGFCVNLCAMAVESYVHNFDEVIDVLKETDY